MAEAYVSETPNFRAIAGEDIIAGELVSICATDEKAYLACADSGTEELPAMGVAETTADEGEAVAIKRLGRQDGYESLTAGAGVYVSNTPGAISTTAGDTIQFAGIAVTDTQWIIDPEIIAAQTQH